MSDSPDELEQKAVHPVTTLVKGCIPAFSIFSFLVFCGGILCSCYLVFNSSQNLDGFAKTAGQLALSVATLLFISILGLNAHPGIFIEEYPRRKLDNFFIANVFLIALGFLQTIFWVIDPGNNIHEPRSVFILAVAGSAAYFHQQYLKYITVLSSFTEDE